MARNRSSGSIEAEKLYHEGMKLVDIAKKIGVPDSTVRRWKSTQKWDGDKSEQGKKKEVERSDKRKPNARKSKGAPKGNKNAVGHVPSTPKRNKNAETHGAYSKVYWDALDDEELDLIDSMANTEEEQLIMQLQMFSVRERRLMKSIKRYREMEVENHGLSVKSVSKTKKTEDLMNFDGESIEDGKYKKITETSVTNTEAIMNSIMVLEAELTKVQRAKTKAIETLSKYRLEKAKLESESAGNDAVDDWIAAVLGKDKGEDVSSDE